MKLPDLSFLDWSQYLSFFLLIFSLILALVRFLKGPNIPDKIVAFDLIVIILMGLVMIYSMLVNQIILLDAVIIMALISFLSTVAYAKYLEKGVSE